MTSSCCTLRQPLDPDLVTLKIFCYSLGGISGALNCDLFSLHILSMPAAIIIYTRYSILQQYKQVHLFMQKHEKRKPWQVIIPSKYQLTMIYTKCWLLLLSHWDESILLSYHICIKSQQLMSRITNVQGHKIFSQLNFTHRWLSIVFQLSLKELHNADKSIAEHCDLCINLSVFISQ